MALTLTSISPVSGPPGTAVTCLGVGFAPDSQVGCPTLVATTYVDAATLTAEIPSLAGAAGSSVPIAVFVMGANGDTSNVLMFAVLFPATAAPQAWTTVDAVVAEIPGFSRGGRIKDADIQTWIRSVAQEIAAGMLRRGLSLDPATWQQAGTVASPNPVDVLEMANRMGAGARLAAAVGAQFSGQGEWGVSKNLQAAYARQLAALAAGDYDKLFRPSAATVEAGPQFASGDMTRADGSSSGAFRKDKKF